MNFLLSSIFAERLRDAVRLEPLRPYEIRRIVGMGEKYIALSNTAIDTNVYTNMVEVAIDGVNHVIYAKVIPMNGARIRFVDHFGVAHLRIEGIQ